MTSGPAEPLHGRLAAALLGGIGVRIAVVAVAATAFATGLLARSTMTTARPSSLRSADSVASPQLERELRDDGQTLRGISHTQRKPTRSSLRLASRQTYDGATDTSLLPPSPRIH